MMRKDELSAGYRHGVGGSPRLRGGWEGAREFAGADVGERAERIRDQIERLLAYPKVGPLGPGAIARNLEVEAPEIAAILAELEAEGRLRRVAGGFVAARGGVEIK